MNVTPRDVVSVLQRLEDVERELRDVRGELRDVRRELQYVNDRYERSKYHNMRHIHFLQKSNHALWRLCNENGLASSYKESLQPLDD